MPLVEESAPFQCPHCQAEFDADSAGSDEPLPCPNCGELLTIQSEDLEPAPVDELDSARMAGIARARTAALRAGSYSLIGAATFAVAAIDLIWRAACRLQSDQTILWPVLYLFAAILLTWQTRAFMKKAARFRREARRSSLPIPTTGPDFSTLSDGSQMARNLQNLQ